MPTNPEPKPVRLDPPGPYETPVAIELQRVRVATEVSPARLCLTLEDGCSLHIPMLSAVVEKLRLALEDYPEHHDFPELR
jgi:hypothetical protein